MAPSLSGGDGLSHRGALQVAAQLRTTDSSLNVAGAVVLAVRCCLRSCCGLPRSLPPRRHRSSAELAAHLFTVAGINDFAALLAPPPTPSTPLPTRSYAELTTLRSLRSHTPDHDLGLLARRQRRLRRHVLHRVERVVLPAALEELQAQEVSSPSPCSDHRCVFRDSGSLRLPCSPCSHH